MLSEREKRCWQKLTSTPRAQRCLLVVVSSETSLEGQARSVHMKTEQEDLRKRKRHE